MSPSITALITGRDQASTRPKEMLLIKLLIIVKLNLNAKSCGYRNKQWELPKLKLDTAIEAAFKK